MLCVFTVQDGTKDHTNIHDGCKACARKVHSERGAPKARSENPNPEPRKTVDGVLIVLIVVDSVLIVC